jgi:DNA replication protein DnaC
MTDAPQILLAHHLKALKLPTFLREYDKVARLCAAEGVDHPRYLMRLAEMEMIDRERRMVDRRIKAARFPTVKSLDSFDFLALPTLNKMLVLELARSDYIERRENIIAVGNSEPDSYCSPRYVIGIERFVVLDFLVAACADGGFSLHRGLWRFRAPPP